MTVNLEAAEAGMQAEGAPADALPLSWAQRRLWLVQRLDPAASAYNVAMSFRLRGPLEADRLRAALEEVVARHEALRTTFEVVDGEAVQVFHPRVALPWQVLDLSTADAPKQAEEIRRLRDEEATRPFDLAVAPILRSRLVRLGAEDHLWFLTVHHVVFDGWSQEVLIDDVGSCYRRLGGAGGALPELPIQYADFAVWQEEQLSGERIEELARFWRRELEGYPTVLRLPTDRPRPQRQTFRGEVVSTVLPSTTLERVEALAAGAGATPFMVFLAAWHVVLHRLTGEERILVGSPTAGRTHPEAERLIGCFVNTLVLRGDLVGDPDFRTFLGRVRAATLAAVDHQDLVFDQLVEALHPERHASFSPLVQVGFSLDPFALAERELAPGLLLEPQEHAIKSAKSDLTLMVQARTDGVRCILEYNSDLLDGATAERWLGYLEHALETVLADPAARLSALSLVGEEERRLLLAEWPAAPAAAHRATGLAEAFALQAAVRTDAVAVDGPEGALTYGELDRRSAALARTLSRLGVARGTPVALALERSAETVLAALAVIRAGGAYAPLDPDYPEERRRLVMADLAAPVLVTRSGLLDRLGEMPGVRVLCLDSLDGATVSGWDEPPGHPDDLAYVIYTSGSTGRPKGVAIPHRGVARLVLDADYTRFAPGEAMLHLSSVSFDAATFEIWGPLASGGRLVLFPAETPSPRAVRTAVARHRVTRLFLTTALFNQVAEEAEEIPGCLFHLMTGGEQASAGHFRRVFEARPRLLLSNLYGPTENTTLSTHQPVVQPPDPKEPVPIGHAVAGSSCWVLDRRLSPSPTGVAGELLVGGDGLARGYWRRPGVTAERFVPHPYSTIPGERLYATGDLVRWRPGGTLEFLGRNDFQVKVRGFRIEPGEVETALDGHPDVAEALVVVRELGGQPALVGYYVPREPGTPAPADLREDLRRSLPAYMVPTALVELEGFPLNAHGKVDRAALPEPDRSLGTERAGYQAPRTPLEEEIAAIWREVLGVDGVGIHDDFFDLGGHSLLGTQVLARLGDEFGVDLPLRALFEAPTVAGLAASLGAALLAEETGGPEGAETTGRETIE